MRSFFFDHFANGRWTRDETGTGCPTPGDARLQAMGVLPAIARDEVARAGDMQAYSVVMRDEAGRPVYLATLTLAGIWL